MDPTRFDRQVRMFGQDGQRLIESVTVAIVGCGGLGSHVAQQLAYLGVTRFVLIDPDVVELSNLNRLIGATSADARDRKPKVTVVECLIRAVSPHAEVVAVHASFVSPAGFHALGGAETVFGCLDNDGSRLVLNEYCQAYRKSYWDIATDIDRSDPRQFGGRLLYSTSGEMCVVCKDLLDQAELRRYGASAAQAEEEARIYGVPVETLGTSGPSVVSLNGVLASVAVMEFMVDRVGLREARRSLQYNGLFGVVSVDTDPPAQDCYYCKELYGQGNEGNVSRHFGA
jgi:hypothetical protein